MLQLIFFCKKSATRETGTLNLYEMEYPMVFSFCLLFLNSPWLYINRRLCGLDTMDCNTAKNSQKLAIPHRGFQKKGFVLQKAEVLISSAHSIPLRFYQPWMWEARTQNNLPGLTQTLAKGTNLKIPSHIFLPPRTRLIRFLTGWAHH